MTSNVEGDVFRRDQCVKLIQGEWYGQLLKDTFTTNKYWVLIDRNARSILSSRDIKVVLMAKFGQLDPNTEDASIKIDMYSANLKHELLTMAREHGTGGRLDLKDVNVILKFYPGKYGSG